MKRMTFLIAAILLLGGSAKGGDYETLHTEKIHSMEGPACSGSIVMDASKMKDTTKKAGGYVDIDAFSYTKEN